MALWMGWCGRSLRRGSPRWALKDRGWLRKRLTFQVKVAGILSPQQEAKGYRRAWTEAGVGEGMPSPFTRVYQMLSAFTSSAQRRQNWLKVTWGDPGLTAEGSSVGSCPGLGGGWEAAVENRDLLLRPVSSPPTSPTSVPFPPQA